MAINAAGQYSGDIEQFIQDEVLPVAQRQLVIYQAGDMLELPQGRGTTYTATRFNRIPLPYAPLSEGVPPVGETMTITQVTGQCLQWGDKVELTDVAELTVKHPLMNTANKLIGLQIGETLERNTFNALLAGTQVNYVNQRGSRSALQASDVLDPHTINRTVAALLTIGAYQFDGPDETNVKFDANTRSLKSTDSPLSSPHYLGIAHHLVLGDFSENQTFVLASSYSNINLLYNYEVGYWRGVRFCGSNLVPSWTGFANSGFTATAGTSGSLATGTYYVQVTGSDNQNQYESRIYAVSASVSVTGPTGSISVALPSTAGFTYNVYIGTSSSPQNLGLTNAGPSVGPYAGQATQLAPGATVVITGTGITQVPPASPATGVTVYPTFVIGRGFFGQVKLDDVKVSWLAGADKSDPLNQLRIIGWKVFYGTLIENQLFGCRIESASAFSATFS